MAWGLIIISGRNPSRVKGISCSGIIIPMVPFCPERDAILSPIAGMRSSLILIFAMRVPSSPSVINALCTIPFCPFLVVSEQSINVSLSGTVVVIPIIMVSSVISVPSFTNPYLSILL